MQIFPVDSVAADPMPAPSAVDSGLARTFRVVFRRDVHGSMWRVDVVADSAMAAVESVAYAEQLSYDLVLGVMDLATLR